jgi:hypothetical protein
MVDQADSDGRWLDVVRAEGRCGGRLPAIRIGVWAEGVVEGVEDDSGQIYDGSG